VRRLAELDTHLARLREAAARVGANLIELEQAPTTALLEAADLAGETAVRWTRARLALAQLFTSYASLVSVLDAATTVRGARSTLAPSKVAELTALLLGPSIALSDDAMPLAERDLLAQSRALVRTNPDDLLVRMTDEYRDVRDVVVEVDRVWDELLPRTRQAQARASAIAELLDGDDLSTERLGEWIAELDDLCHQLRTDPLSADGGPLESIEHHLSRLSKDRAALEQLRRRWSDVSATARLRMEELARLDAAMAAQQRETAEKVVCAVRAPAALEPLSQGLARIEHAARAGRWMLVSNELDGWHRAVDDATARLMQDAAEDRAALEARRQLRGLVDAYVGKARALGHLEDALVDGLVASLEEELYRAPTDLLHATELMHRLQVAFAAPTEALPR
jgi:hypothetical protein